MDKVLKQRLIGATILIALAVIFVPMLFDGPQDRPQQQPVALDLPQPSGDREPIRRLALEPEPSRGGTGLPSDREPRPASERSRADISDAIDLLAREPEAETGDEAPAAEVPADVAPPMPLAEPEMTEPEPIAQAARDTDPEPEPEIAPEPEVEPATPTPPVASPPATASGEPVWLVQVVTYGALDSAEQTVEQLDRLGHAAHINPLVRANTRLHRVRTGPYASRSAADQAAAQIRQTLTGVEPVVVHEPLPSSVASAAGGAEAGYAVQVGSFSARDNVDRLVSQLEEAGFVALTVEDRSGQRTIWRVRIGPVGSRADAERRLVQLREMTGQDGIVVSHP
ncbi:MAG: SPOR domain-containing protein [Wenzhouxiangella sp.]